MSDAPCLMARLWNSKCAWHMKQKPLEWNLHTIQVDNHSQVWHFETVRCLCNKPALIICWKQTNLLLYQICTDHLFERT